MKNKQQQKVININENPLQKTVKYIDEIYKNEKGKTFILHLIRAFLPINLELLMLEVPEGTKCCLTGANLLNIDKLISKRVKTPDLGIEINESIKSTDKMFDKITKLKSLIPIEIPDPCTVLYSKKSDKLMTVESVLALTKFVIKELINGDKEINFIINQKVFGVKPKKFKPKLKLKYRTNKNETLGDIFKITKNSIKLRQ